MIHTGAVIGCQSCIHYRLVDRLDGKHASEIRVEMRERGHDRCPHQCTVIVVWGLYVHDRWSMVITSEVAK